MGDNFNVVVTSFIILNNAGCCCSVIGLNVLGKEFLKRNDLIISHNNRPPANEIIVS